MAKSDNELLDSARGGDADALQLLLERYDARVRHQVDINPKWRAMVDSDDILQVTYLEAFLEIACFKGDAEVFGCWLDRIARNNLLDAVKELERAKRPQPEDRVRAPRGQDSVIWLYDYVAGSGTTPSQGVARAEIRRVLEEEIDALPPDYGNVLRRMYFEEKSVAEIAEAMGRTPGAVRLLHIRAKERLKQWFGSGSQFFSR